MNLREFSDQYLELLQGPFKGINLTRILSPEEFYWKQVQDSVAVLEKSQVFKKSLDRTAFCVDVGFGGGFPLLALAKSCPEVSFLGLEARGKKVKAVREIASHLGLRNVRVAHQRVENVLFDRAATITFKAVGPIADFLACFHGTCPVEVFFYKGPNLDEQENWKSSLTDWELIEDIQFTLTGEETRRFLGFRSKNVPRGTTRNNNLLAKVSQF